MTVRWRWYLRFVVVAAVSTLPIAVSHGAPPTQYPVAGAPAVEISPTLPMGRERPEDEIPFGNREIQARQMRRLREEHQKQVFADTARLLQLATTLKEEADKGTKPSPGTLKDVDEIAKLAKRLSDRIKNQ